MRDSKGDTTTPGFQRARRVVIGGALSPRASLKVCPSQALPLLMALKHIQPSDLIQEALLPNLNEGNVLNYAPINILPMSSGKHHGTSPILSIQPTAARPHQLSQLRLSAASLFSPS